MGLLIRLLCCWFTLALAMPIWVVEASLAGVENAADLVVVVSGASDKGTVGGSIRSCNWDNRLTNGPGVSSIVYDADGNRIKKVAGSTTTWYLVATVNPTGYPPGCRGIHREHSWNQHLEPSLRVWFGSTVSIQLIQDERMSVARSGRAARSTSPYRRALRSHRTNFTDS